MAVKKSRGGFNDRLHSYGKWHEKANMDRFLTLVFLTAEEKRTWCETHLGDQHVCYFDGDDVAGVELKDTAKQKST